MKKLLFLALFVFFIALFTACSSGGSNSFNGGLSIDYMPFSKEEEDLIGMLDKNLKPLFENEFEGIASPVVDGVFFVADRDGGTLYKAGKKPTVIKGCDNLISAGVMSEGIIPIVKENSRITYIDKDGKEKFTLKPHKGKEIVSVSPFFIGNKAWITVEEEMDFGYYYTSTESFYGAINSSGNVIVEPIYKEIKIFEDFILVEKRNETKSGNIECTVYLFDNNGKKLHEFKNKSIPSEKHFVANKGQFMLESDNSYLLYDKSGQQLKKFSKDKEYTYFIYQDFCIYFDLDKDKVGIKNFKNNETIIRPKYQLIIPVDNNTFLAYTDYKEKKWNLIDKENNKITSLEGKEICLPLGIMMSSIGFNADGWDDYIVAIEDNGYLQLFNKKGEEIPEGEYHMNAYNWIKYLYNGVRSAYKEEGYTETATETICETAVEEVVMETSTY